MRFLKDQLMRLNKIQIKHRFLAKVIIIMILWQSHNIDLGHLRRGTFSRRNRVLL